MVQCYTTDYLKLLKAKILSSKVTEQDIVDFVSAVQSINNFDSIELKLLTLEIYILLKRIDNFIPLIDLTLDSLPAKIILATESNTENTQELPQEEISCAPVEIPTETTSCRQSDNMSDLEKELIAKWSPFKREDYPGLLFPEEGQIGNIQFDDHEIREGKVYHADVAVDHEGNILYFKSGPTEMMEAKDYEEIYAGLVGQLFDFQQQS